MKKKRTGLIIFFIIVILAVAGAAAYYFIQRAKPAAAVETFLDHVQKMDFDGMSAQLQSSDLSALDDADIRDGAYAAFFQTVNEKMSYKITKNDFNIQNGTANVTAHIKYIDGSEIYKEAVTEFIRQIVASAFSGQEMTEEETQRKLAALLEEKSQSVSDVFTEIDITYPLIQAQGEWKIVSLDDSTVLVMSANIKNVQDEVNQTLVDMESGDGSPSGTPAADASSLIDMTNDKFTIHYTKYLVSQDFAGDPCLLVYYDYTNNGTTASSAMVDVSLQAYQDGSLCEAAIPASNEDAIDKYMAEIQPGQTVNVCQAFSISGQSDVTLQAGEAFSFGGGTTTSQILKITQ